MAKMPKPKMKWEEPRKPFKIGKRTSLAKKAPPKKGLFSRIRQYFREVRQELKKVVWPSRREVLAASLVVIAIIVIFSLLIGGLDFLLVKLVKFVTFKF